MTTEAWVMVLGCVPLVLVEAHRWRMQRADRKAFDARMATMKAKHEAWMNAHGKGPK